MRDKILKVLERFGCPEDGVQCQINLQSEGARIMIADALEEEFTKYTMNLIEDVVTPMKHSPMPKFYQED